MADPWLKFYPTDWRSDPRLRMCGLAARGLWIEMLALMHEAQPYGHLLVSGHSPTDTQLAVLVGASPDQIPDLLGELETAGVFSRTKEDVIYSRKMTRMAKKSAVARKNGKNGGNPSLGKQMGNSASDNQQDNPRLKPQKPEARSQSSPDTFANAKASAVEVETKPPPTAEPVTKKEQVAGSAEDRFWSLAGRAAERGIARSTMGQLAKALNGDFGRGVGIVTDAMAAKGPRPYLAKIIRNLKAEASPSLPLASPDVPQWVSEARAQGYPAQREGRYWRMAGALYDDGGEQVGN